MFVHMFNIYINIQIKIKYYIGSTLKYLECVFFLFATKEPYKERQVTCNIILRGVRVTFVPGEK